jgi:hypothetical protein
VLQVFYESVGKFFLKEFNISPLWSFFLVVRFRQKVENASLFMFVGHTLSRPEEPARQELSLRSDPNMASSEFQVMVML